MSTFINIAVALAVCAWLFYLQRRRASFAVQVFTGMGLGVALGAVMHWVYGVESPVIKNTNAYLDIVGSGYEFIDKTAKPRRDFSRCYWFIENWHASLSTTLIICLRL